MRRNSTILLLLATFAYAPNFSAQQQEISWAQNATSLRGNNGEQYVFQCPPADGAGSVWGTDIYSDDSSICTAAVHAGAITPSGGLILIEIRGGRGSYAGSERNGITSAEWGEWNGSFVIVDGAIAWTANATGITGETGDRIPLLCPAGSSGTVWGSGPYTDDSSICTAAVHAGVITLEGGPVIIEIQGGRSSFEGSRRNGVRTSDYGRWGRSFVFR